MITLCNNCGTRLTSDSFFCFKCGKRIIDEDSAKAFEEDHTVISISTEEVINDNDKTILLKNKKTYFSSINSKTKIGIAVIAVLSFLIYLFNYSNAVVIANDLYTDGEFHKAETKIKAYFPLSSEDSQLFNRIKLLNNCNRNMEFFDMYAKSEFMEKDMKSALESLLNGYQECKNNGVTANRYDIGYKITSLEHDYLTKLNEYYNISTSKADELISLDYSSRSNEIEKLYSRGETISKQKEQEKLDSETRDRNPIKFSELTLSSNSSYTIIEGTATNISDRTLEFVEVKGLFKDSTGKVIDTDWSYAVGSEGLSPNQSSKFRMSVKKDSRITNASVELK